VMVKAWAGELTTSDAAPTVNSDTATQTPHFVRNAPNRARSSLVMSVSR